MVYRNLSRYRGSLVYFMDMLPSQKSPVSPAGADGDNFPDVH